MASFKEQMRGFPVWQIVVISIMRFLEPLAFTSLFPYVYFMIRDFHIAKDEAQISKYAGYLSASFAFTQFLFSIQWGTLSDKIGRKKVLLMGLFGTSVSLITFGFSPNYYVALFARSFMGAVNGNIAVLRTSIGEMVTERNHQAIAFSTLPLLWNVGSVIGPLIGGSKYLTRPKNTNDGSDVSIADLETAYDDFLNKYPYALSNIVVSLFLWLGIVCGWLFLEETHHRIKYKRDIGLDVGDWILNRLGFQTPARPWNKSRFQTQKKSITGLNNVNSGVNTPASASHARTPGGVLGTVTPTGVGASNTNTEFRQQGATETSELLQGISSNEEDIDSGDDDSTDSRGPDQPRALYSAVDDAIDDDEGSIKSCDSGESVGILSRRMSNAFIRRYSSKSTMRPQLTATISRISGISLTQEETNLEDTDYSEVFTPPVIQTIIANFLLAFHNVIYNEFLPVFLAAQLMPDKLQFPFKISGGFGFDSDFIGTLISTTGICGVMVVIFIFPYLDRNFKAINNYRVAQFLFPVIYFILPFYIFTLTEYNPKFDPNLTRILLYINAGFYQLASATAFPQIVLLVHRAAPPKHRAFINGTSLSLNALARFIAPLIWGILMSYFDQTNHGGFTWFVLAFITIGCLIQSFTMEEYDEDAKVQSEV